MEHRGDRTAELPVKVLRDCFSEPLLLWPVERVSNKAVSEKAWMAGFRDSPLHVEGFTVRWKDEERQEHKHFLAVRAESSDKPACCTVSSCYQGQCTDVDSDMSQSVCN